MQSRIERHFSDHVVDSRSKDWLAVILGPAISVPFATCYAALICSDASLRNHFPMVLQYLGKALFCHPSFKWDNTNNT